MWTSWILGCKPQLRSRYKNDFSLKSRTPLKLVDRLPVLLVFDYETVVTTRDDVNSYVFYSFPFVTSATPPPIPPPNPPSMSTSDLILIARLEELDLYVEFIEYL
jgi:hypothetical protein